MATNDESGDDIGRWIQEARAAGWDDAMEEASGQLSLLYYQNGVMRDALLKARQFIEGAMADGAASPDAGMSGQAREALAAIAAALDPDIGPPRTEPEPDEQA